MVHVLYSLTYLPLLEGQIDQLCNNDDYANPYFVEGVWDILSHLPLTPALFRFHCTLQFQSRQSKNPEGILKDFCRRLNARLILLICRSIF